MIPMEAADQQGKRLSIPLMTLLASAGGVLLLVFLASSYLLSTNLTTNAVHKITDQVLTQSAKTAQRIFDEKIIFAYLDVQALGLSHALVTAAADKDSQAISEALQNIYLLGAGDSVYNILFYQSVEDDLLVDESFSAKKIDTNLKNAIVSTVDSVPHKQKITLFEHENQTYIVMAASPPVKDGRIYAALKLWGPLKTHP